MTPVAVSVTKAGELLGVSGSTIRRLVADGHLPRVPHTHRLVISVKALEAFADSDEVAA